MDQHNIQTDNIRGVIGWRSKTKSSNYNVKANKKIAPCITTIIILALIPNS